ncbi:hypothetical protein [Streptomyces zagrosensis]|uniref:Lipoprotein n=1 Tax=Streptomyces zagrosensis TaxID=1042984 RepID=A0A7W9UXV3_9ACTN|nr:hypothetical protein [Streptomyces zagrosensis]MBB5935012.1 hypothetical protein [Streptomyces zagrosensis]
MNIHTASRRATRLRLAAAVAAPLLVLGVACGGGDDAGSKASDKIASVPDEPTADGAAGKDKGSSKPTAEGKSAFFDAQLTYVRCMRTKGGVKDFPDPKLSGYLNWPEIDKITDPNGGGEEQKGGKNGVCFPELSEAMKLEPKRDSQKDYESMLAHATCMRENGVPQFTNPTMSGGGVMPGGDPDPLNSTIDHQSPAYKQAREACKGKLLEGLDGMQ